MTSPLKRPLEVVRNIRGVAPDSRWTAAKGVSTRLVKQVAHRARRRVTTGQVRVVELGLGAEAANRYFWNAPTKDPIWFDVLQRLEHLERRQPDAIPHFVRQCCDHVSDPTALIGLARHPASAETCAAWLREHAMQRSDSFAARLQQSRLLGGAVGGAARLVLAEDEADLLIGWVADVYQLPDSRLFQVLDSVGVRLDGDPDGPSLRRQSRRRLILTEHATDQGMLSLLIPGAEHVTIVPISDTFGRADFTGYADWTTGGGVAVEHIRSRITRFSAEYVALHEAVARRTERYCDRIADVADLIRPDDRPFLDAEAADVLFFQALKIRSLDLLLADPGFDHIVVALADQRDGHEYLQLLASVDGLLEDPRVEIVSISRSAATRSAFWSQLDSLAAVPAAPPAPARSVPEVLVLRKFDEDTRRLAATLPRFPAASRPSVLLVTANNAAYNDSTAAYAADLAVDADVEIVHLGRNATQLVTHLDEVDASDIPLSFHAPTPERFDALAELILTAVRPAVPEDDGDAGASSDPAERAARVALECSDRRLVQGTIAPALARLRTVHHWFAALRSNDMAPDLVVLTPSRTVGVGAITTAARRFAIPTLILEPHAQDANYCRYLKIASDYYGVMSDYFRRQAIAGFGTSPERTITVGSPRQVAPPGYDPAAERRSARTAYHSDHGVDFPDDVPHLVFFCQPSGWDHVSKIWGHVLDAASRTGSRILLKTHPEETATRRQQYLDQASAQGFGDQVVLLEGDASTAIALADIAITAYSAAGIDAAIRRTPVICVTDGDLEYPVDLPAILGAPMARSADELAELIASYRTDPTELQDRAQSLLERERQFVEGPGPRLRALVADILALGPGALRPIEEVPTRLFLDEPHPLFPV